MAIGQVAGPKLNFAVNKIGVYILRCINQRYYIGSTADFERRLEEHNEGKMKATKYLLPVHPVFFQTCKTATEARKLEYQLKRKKSRKILEAIIQDGYIKFAGA
ncbi:MAG: GIY-YIG nuclease family protein [Candidatus Sungbacteria bacterium]|uniref:GIY-YIG nuclease family protein n=1 Tax=Candidatus Sungiibacteriota bacterium TaxID=2750080 RepID=A0A932YWS9_9BACT|nr:GIY-YIG nuclease family protein [Candidatus Sungbacteria bacterium]